VIAELKHKASILAPGPACWCERFQGAPDLSRRLRARPRDFSNYLRRAFLASAGKRLAMVVGMRIQNALMLAEAPF
jgi:hypothetical protein